MKHPAAYLPAHPRRRFHLSRPEAIQAITAALADADRYRYLLLKALRNSETTK